MNKPDLEHLDNTDNFSLRDIILKIQEWCGYLLSKWRVILIAGILGGAIGLTYSIFKKPVYTATLSFALQDEKAGGGLSSSAAGLASQFGIDLGGGNGGEFSGDNLLELMKSRSMVEKTLLTTVSVNGKTETLAEFYIDINKFREAWQTKLKLVNLHFLANADPSKFTVSQDSLISAFHGSLIKNNLEINKLDKKLSIAYVKVSSTNEFFAKSFAEALERIVSDYYIHTKTEKASRNVGILQRQTDSVRRALNAAISGVAISADVNPNPNLSRQVLRVPAQRRQVDVQANTLILGELVKNLEIAKMSLLQATPLIRVIDSPVLPLDMERVGKSKGILYGGIISGFLTVVILLCMNAFKSVMTRKI